ncbi:hypothetical protein DPSP01_014552 [Paraphaeosphaeria sporulosa]
MRELAAQGRGIFGPERDSDLDRRSTIGKTINYSPALLAQDEYQYPISKETTEKKKLRPVRLSPKRSIFLNQIGLLWRKITFRGVCEDSFADG